MWAQKWNQHQIQIKQIFHSFQRAFRQYEQAMGAAANMADRMSQMEAMDGAARCLESLRLQVCVVSNSKLDVRALNFCFAIFLRS